MKNGFTIIEVLVVTVAVVTILLALMGSLFSLYKVANKTESISIVSQEGQWIMSQIRDVVVHADTKSAVITCNTGVGFSASSILDGGQTSISCKNIYPFIASSSSGIVTPLVAKGLRVPSCETFVDCSDLSAIRIAFTLEIGNSGFFDTYASRTFNDTFVVRN